MRCTVVVTVGLKEGMLDPEARAIQHALANLGFPTDDRTTAREEAARMCERSLANPENNPSGSAEKITGILSGPGMCSP